jgi:hypothetical protein
MHAQATPLLLLLSMAGCFVWAPTPASSLPSTGPLTPAADGWRWTPLSLPDVVSALEEAAALDAAGNMVAAAAILQRLISRYNLEDWALEAGAAVGTYVALGRVLHWGGAPHSPHPTHQMLARLRTCD